MLPLVAERTRQTTAAGVGRFQLESNFLEELLFSIHPHEGLLVAVAVKQCLALQPRRAVAGFHQELTEQKDLPTEALGVLIMREEVHQFIPEHGNATWLQAH